MTKQALGLIETVGLTAAIEAADAAMKAANVKLIGYELSGGGMTMVKVIGDVGAVQAAIGSARAAAARIGAVFSSQVIPRPAEGIKKIVYTSETKGWEETPAIPMPATLARETEKVSLVIVKEESQPLAMETKKEAAPAKEAKQEAQILAQAQEIKRKAQAQAPTKQGEVKPEPQAPTESTTSARAKPVGAKTKAAKSAVKAEGAESKKARGK